MNLKPSGAWYNEVDAKKAAWLRELIKAGLIAPGDVDERSIVDVRGSELAGYAQCHFFAGVGVWSYALRGAGWEDDRPVWTGSCPCPSFSAAGKGTGFRDPRHLWPHWFRLIGECAPATVFGEQVGAAIGHGWLDLVQTDLEAQDYAVGKIVFGAHSVGAPHIRQRLYFCADTERDGGWTDLTRRESQWRVVDGRDCPVSDRSHADGRHPSAEREQRGGEQRLFAEDRGTGERDDADHRGSQVGWPQGDAGMGRRPGRAQDAERIGAAATESGCGSLDRSHPTQRGLPMRGISPGSTGHAAQPGESGKRQNATRKRLERGTLSDREPQEGASGLFPARSSDDAVPSDDAECARLQGHFGDVRDWRGPGWLDPHEARSVAAAGATRGFWADCDWWYGRDGRYRPIGPGVQPLAHGVANRVVKLRGYGDGLVAPQATEFIKAYIEARG